MSVDQHDPSAAEPMDVTPEGTAVKSVSRTQLVLRRFIRKPRGIIGLIGILLMFLLAFVGPFLTKWSYSDADIFAYPYFHGPTSDHFFGTTQTGYDVYAQTLRGLQKSLLIGLGVAVISTAIAAIVGSIAGYFGKLTDRVLSWLTELLLVMPSFLILAILSQRLPKNGLIIFIVLLAAFMWMLTSKIVRNMTISYKDREFVRAARYMGVSPFTIIRRHILPNIASLLIVDATINVASAILQETGLSYFGFGVQPPDMSLGTIIRDSQAQATTYWWTFYPAAIVLIITILSVNLFGDALRDAIDPTSDR